LEIQKGRHSNLFSPSSGTRITGYNTASDQKLVAGPARDNAIWHYLKRSHLTPGQQQETPRAGATSICRSCLGLINLRSYGDALLRGMDSGRGDRPLELIPAPQTIEAVLFKDCLPVIDSVFSGHYHHPFRLSSIAGAMIASQIRWEETGWLDAYEYQLPKCFLAATSRSIVSGRIR